MNYTYGVGENVEVKVNNFARKHQLFHEGATVLVGVSGGPDSMALLHYLAEARTSWKLRLIALSVDHGLRGDQAKEDVDFVEAICKQWNIEFVGTFLDVPSYKKKYGKGTQVSAREMRYHFFGKQMKKFKADYLALGHHGDDQVETMVMRLVRGTNPSSLTGIPIKRDFAGGSIVRPFLCLSKDEIGEYCRLHGINPRIDPSNEEDNYTRNFYRLHIVPLLKKQNPNLMHHMQRLSESMTQDDMFMQMEAEKAMNKSVLFDEKQKKARLSIKMFRGIPLALQRRAFHLILNYLYQSVPADLSYIHEEQFFGLLHSPKPNITVDFPSGLIISKAYEEITFSFENVKPIDFYITLSVPGEAVLPDGSIISASITDCPVDNKGTAFVCELENITLPLIIRSRKQGDRMKIKGMKGRKKLKDIFIDEKIPMELREKWPVVTDAEGEILWLAGLKKGIVNGNEESRKFLQLNYKKKSDM
ncbi:tRNA lysidine(34) synthetase TilS [Sediminibacillus massiliensis]|uniref:tRNA lysidine(34) synthetase TilS n=1 Tax=Sediminibacillus massiliensis TaxID=1926277 RepID=UPI001FE25B98|nr:tRNA lysidine(34) synthetase TilS [Sediminibacillus massiliensis]